MSIFRKSVTKIQVSFKSDRITGTLRADRYTFLITNLSFLLRMRHISEKSCRENQNTHFTFNNFIFRKCAFNEIMWENTVQPDRPQKTIWRMRTACWIPKATNTHSEYAILAAFPRQQWLQERASMLRYTYFACIDIY